MYVCTVCSLPTTSQNAYAQHLRGRSDAGHQKTLEAYETWLSKDRRTYRCSKCGTLYERTAFRKRSGPGLCVECRRNKDSLSSRAYEALPTRSFFEARAGWENLLEKQEVWTPREVLVDGVRATFQGPEKVREAMDRLGISFDLFRAVGVYLLGEDGYRVWAKRRVFERTARMGKAHADRYRSLSPAEKAEVLKRRFPRARSRIETRMSEFLTKRGESFVTNDWQALLINGTLVPREADLKIDLGTSKVVVECDGEAWHGPNFIFGDANRVVKSDLQTANAYFEAGYSVLRYSETEIMSGEAEAHLGQALDRLRLSGGRVFRLWYPLTETWT